MASSTHGSSGPQSGGLAASKAARFALRAGLYGSLAAAVAAVAYFSYRAAQDRAAMREGQNRLVAQLGLVQPARKALVPPYVDIDKNLVADPPGDPAQCIDPETLVVAHYEGDDDDAERVDWNAFREQLAEATAKTVALQEYLNSADEIATVKAGQIQIVALHAADTPYLVNQAGFAPIAVLGTESGASGNHLVIAANPKTAVHTFDDLRGRRLTCTRPDSITGYRAAIAILSQEAGMRPHVDYRVHFSFGQTRSVRGLVDGEFEVAALSHDKLAAMLGAGEIKPDQYRIVYESRIIPRLTIGHVHNLKPELAEKIKKAVLDFDNANAAGDESAGGPMRFFAIDYRQDFEFVRRIDDSFDPRFGKKPRADLKP